MNPMKSDLKPVASLAADAGAPCRDRLFDTGDLQADLKGRCVRGGAATFAGQGAKLFLQLGSTMILARLLTPKDFGLVAMVAAVTGFIMVFKDLGLSMATVQRAQINHGQVSTLFWINVAISATLMLITLALAPVVAWFYKEPRLIAVTAVLSTAFPLGGLTVQHQALLRRQMRLSAVATIDVVSMAAGVLAAISSALAGWGYWALVWMQIATAATTAAGAWIASGWRPGWPVRRSGVRSMLAFGSYLTGFSFSNYFTRNLDGILIGRFCGAQPLGMYSRAYSLLLFPIGQVIAPMTGVAVPALSQLQRDPNRYRSYYLRAVKTIAYLTFPLVIALAVLARELVGLVLGGQWLAASPIFMVLAVAAFWQPVVSTVGWVYVSLGQTRRMFAWSCIEAPLTVLFLLLGLPWGAIGVAGGYSIINCALIYPMLAFALKGSPVRVTDFFSSIYRPFAISTVTGLVMVVARGYLIKVGLIWTIAGCLAVGGLTFLLLSRCLDPVWEDIMEILSTASLVLAKKRRVSPHGDR
jgi:PST family polysaccharide transporter